MKTEDKYLILALDHRSSLKKLLNLRYPEAVSNKELIAWKTTALKSLLPLVTHILVDPDSGLPALNTIGKADHKVILSIEESSYTENQGERLSRLKYSVKELKQLGADLVKLFLYFNPQAQTAKQQLALIEKVSADCQETGIPFLLEIIPYPVDGKDPSFDAQKTLLESINEISRLNYPVDIYKIGFPGDEGCRKVSEMLTSPWVLLSLGDEFIEYKNNLQTAIANGASGFAAGRSLWQDFTNWPIERWPEFFETTVKDRLRTIIDVVKNPAKNTGFPS
ncbi:DUF2090 domain-containing protein [Patescibacteria group bacterium]|nr:DUF2090 domain-containing protein [Patescibacteria group bacterium]MBU1868037.1 DUF2090 domain-containing protein [Patescibacteria group bacterium]